jgi:hypothetical protein
MNFGFVTEKRGDSRFETRDERLKTRDSRKKTRDSRKKILDSRKNVAVRHLAELRGIKDW